MLDLSAIKLLAFPAKIEAMLSQDIADSSYPISVELSLTNRCSLACRWCGDKSLRAQHPGELSIRLVKRLLDALRAGGTRGVVIEGGGEPTIHRGFREIVAYAGQIGLAAGLVTNGLSNKLIEVAHQFQWIRVSLDASTPQEYTLEKGKDVFERVLTNLAQLVRRGPIMGVGYVVTNANTSRIMEVTERLKGMGVNYIQFRPVVDHPDLLDGISFPERELKALEDTRFRVITEGMANNVVAGNAGLSCRCNSLTSVIAANGDVFLCGRLNVDPSWPPIGNLYEQSFDAIWSGSERKHQAMQMADPAVCLARCPPCRITKFNRLLEAARHDTTPNFI